MPSPPPSLDGATVLAYAHLDETSATGRTRHVLGGRETVGFAHLVLARYPDEPGYYLFYCDDGWAVITDTLHDSRPKAEAQASFEFEGVTFTDV